jgi:tRNA-dihydrouridine synthase
MVQQALERTKLPVCYNGDLVTPRQCLELGEQFPKVDTIMLGWGLLADPALASKAAGGAGATKDAIGGFLDEVYHRYCDDFGSDRNAMLRMKEVWFYLIRLFRDNESYSKKLKKMSDPREYERLVVQVLRDLELKDNLNENEFMQ